MNTTSTNASLTAAGLDPEAVRAHITATLDEDLAWGPDATTIATIDAAQMGTAAIIAHAHGCLAGVPVACAALEVQADRDNTNVDIELLKTDGSAVAPGDRILRVAGPVRTLLTAERTALNYISQLSGVATMTQQWMEALAGTGVIVRDTRKTVPGMRVLQKYAVRCGGGENHRMGLGDAALIKDNHIAAAGSVTAAFQTVRKDFPDLPVEIECDTLDQVREAVAAGAHTILLDNMRPEEARAAVALTRPAGIKTEASGGITLAEAKGYGATGVDYIAVGALTHSTPVLDLGFDLT